MTTEGAWPAAVAHVRDRSRGGPVPPSSRVVLHFHPDAPAGDGTVMEALAEHGVYRSQFETGTSNGGLTAYRGGDRCRWESRLFGGVYDDGPAAGRPRYGALLLDGDPYGAAPRFGSAYLRLRARLLARMTFAYPDSAHAPRHVGTADRFDLAARLLAEPRPDPLDRYVEAHVHGGVVVADGVRPRLPRCGTGRARGADRRRRRAHPGTARRVATRRRGCPHPEAGVAPAGPVRATGAGESLTDLADGFDLRDLF